MDFKLLTQLTKDPKLSYLEWRLDCIGIKHRRNGESFHAPILEVEARNIEAALSLLDEKHGNVTIGEIEDDDPMFANWSRPEYYDESDEESAWYAELERGYAQDRI